MLEAMSQIGQALPHFQSYGTLFKENSRIQEVLVIFYKDILDFHLHVLNFFSTKGEASMMTLAILALIGIRMASFFRNTVV